MLRSLPGLADHYFMRQRNALFLARMLQAQLIWLPVIPEASGLTAAADLVVMRATGHSGLPGVLLGSKTRRVLPSLTYSLLTQRQQDAADQEE